MKATLIHDNGQQRFYRLSEPITKGYSDIGDEYGIFPDDIAGKHTMMIHGGDCRSIYNDGTYLRWLCRLNGLRWEGIE